MSIFAFALESFCVLEKKWSQNMSKMTTRFAGGNRGAIVTGAEIRRWAAIDSSEIFDKEI
jgi:hypothetical protein